MPKKSSHINASYKLEKYVNCSIQDYMKRSTLSAMILQAVLRITFYNTLVMFCVFFK